MTLFGHVKGAFTSAIAAKKGYFEIANGGTLFLDEIGNMSMDTQAKILRVIQDKRFMHLGGVTRSRSTSASSPPPTSTSARPSAKAASARTSTTASMSSR